MIARLNTSSIMFVKKCLTSSSKSVQYVSRYGVCHYGHMASVLGRNAVFGYEQFSLSVNE